MYLYLTPIGLVICFILIWVSSSKAKYYSTPVNDEEAKDFKKPFRFAFWLSILIVSSLFFVFFAYFGFRISSMLKGT